MGEETNELDNQYSADNPDNEIQEVEEIRADIEQTRSELSSTIDAIQEKLNPSTIVDNAKEAVKEATIGRVENMVSNVSDAAQETGSGIMDKIKSNPIPAAMAGIGLFMLLKSNGSNKSQNQNRSYQNLRPNNYGDYYQSNADYSPSGYSSMSSSRSNQGMLDKVMTTVKENPIPAAAAGIGLGYMLMKNGNQSQQMQYPDYGQKQGFTDKVGDTAGNVASKVGDVAGTVGDKVGNVAGNVGDKVNTVTENMGEAVGTVAGNVVGTVQQAPTQFGRMMNDNPMAIGLAAVALGLVIGMMLPETEKENELLGEAHDHLMDKVSNVAQETVQKVQQVGDRVQQTAKEEAHNQGLVE